MNFKWIEYLNLAHDLLGKPIIVNGEQIVSDDEAKFRSSISRSYYSVFICTRNYLCNIECDPAVIAAKGRRDVNIHSFIIRRLKADGEREKRRIGNKLDRMHKDRKEADYDDEISNPEETALDSLDTALEIVESLNNLKREYLNL